MNSWHAEVVLPDGEIRYRTMPERTRREALLWGEYLRSRDPMPERLSVRAVKVSRGRV